MIDIDENRPPAQHVRALADAHAAGQATVAIGAIAASERQRGGCLIANFQEFRQRLASLGLGHLEILTPMLYYDVCFWDHALWSSSEMEAVERRIHDTLFSNVEFLWPDYARAHGLDANAAPAAWEWRNVKCDVQAIWAHIHHRRDVFVTSDMNYHKHSAKLIALGAGSIVTPEQAVTPLS